VGASVERLVREGVFAPDRILATSFGTASVDDLKRVLRAWLHGRTVDIRTLHSPGYDLVRCVMEQFPSSAATQRNANSPSLFY
jgi:hypothetical protein